MVLFHSYYIATPHLTNLCREVYLSPFYGLEQGGSS